MKTRAVVILVALSGVSTGLHRSAHAADGAAERSYQEGRAAAHRKDWTLACQKFRESEDREAAPGTLLNLADCEENRGQLLESMVHFRAAADLFKRGDERVAFATRRAAAIERRLAKLTVRLDPESSPEAIVELDGAALDSATLGAPRRVDPGYHTLIVRAPGRVTAHTTIHLADSEAREVEMAAGVALHPTEATVDPGSSRPRDGDASSQAPSAAEHLALPGPSARESPQAPTVRNPDAGSAMTTTAYVAFGVGGVGVALGVMGGLLTISAKNTVAAQCTPGCSSEGLDAQAHGRAWSTLSTAGFVGGGVGALAGAALLLAAPHSTSAAGLSMGVVPGGGEVGWRTSF
jgi:hypothetical protein